jgi:TIR domain-containing protein
MIVFLSWSGERSKAVAEVFASWIGDVIQVVEPWISVDIKSGVRWSEEIRAKLERSKVGIACLTKENLKSE